MKRISFGAVALLLAAVTGAGPGEGIEAQESHDLLLTGGRVVDGTGNPWVPGDIAVRDGQIVGVGDLSGHTAERVLELDGRMVAPGFIDLHSHAGDAGGGPFARRHLGSEDPRDRAAPNLVAQGATTLVVNQDGRGPWPIRDRIEAYERLGIGPNAILLVGHGTVRGRILGEDFRRGATPDEIDRMRDLVRQAMEEGAYGMSGGHEYVPMRWATTDEIVALVGEVAPWRGIYVVHERSSGPEPMWWWPSQHEPGAPTMIDAVLETIEVAERTGVNSVQTHIKARGSHYWGTGTALVHLIERARARGVPIWADAYSYNTTGSDGRTVLIPPFVREAARREARGAGRGDADYTATLERMLEHPDSAAMIRMDVAHEIRRRGSAGNLLVLEYPREGYVGRTLLELAEDRGLDPVETAIHLQLEGDPSRPGGGLVRGFSLSELDLETFYRQPWVATASDAGITMAGDGSTHPRYYGTFPRRIRRFAIEKELGTIEDAVRSMTSLPAQILGLRDRGLLREGMRADLVVFDPETIRDEATALDPHQYPTGIDFVFVNGEMVIENGEHTWALPGVVITPESAQDRTLMQGGEGR